MKNIIKSLALFHKEMSAVKEDGKNPHFGSRYATLDNILETIKEPLEKAGLTFVQIPLEGGKLKTTIFDVETGESIEGTMDLLVTKQDPQSQGSSLTYARRYSISAMLGIATEVDDDGNKAANVQSPAASLMSPQGKVCSTCGKTHSGQYATCYACHLAKTKS